MILGRAWRFMIKPTAIVCDIGVRRMSPSNLRNCLSSLISRMV